MHARRGCGWKWLNRLKMANNGKARSAVICFQMLRFKRLKYISATAFEIGETTDTLKFHHSTRKKFLKRVPTRGSLTMPYFRTMQLECSRNTLCSCTKNRSQCQIGCNTTSHNTPGHRFTIWGQGTASLTGWRGTHRWRRWSSWGTS